MRTSLLLMTALCAVAFAGCGDDQVANNSLVSTTTEAAGDNCANGGLKFETGLDLNGNDTLDADEVVETEFICSGADGESGDTGDSGLSTLLVTSPEPAGANCTNGGQRIDFGIDDNGDGILDAVEVDGTTFVCDGGIGFNSLIVQTFEPVGVNCLAGGIRIDSGLDTSDDGVLDAGEITDTEFVCNPGLSAITFDADSTFVVPANVFSINALVVGGGGGGANGHQGGGASGVVAMASIAVVPGDTIAVTVGGGGLGAEVCAGCNDIVGNTPGGASAFGGLTAAGGGTPTVINGPGGNGGSGGGGSCNGGSPGGDGGTNGSDGGLCNQAPGTGQGDMSALLAPFAFSVVTAAAGGAGGVSSHSGGGGGGGVLIDGAGPSGQPGAAAFSAGGGTGFGAGGGGGGFDSPSGPDREPGGNGANGVVYIELN